MHAMAHMWRSDLSRCAGPQALVDPPAKTLAQLMPHWKHLQALELSM